MKSNYMVNVLLDTLDFLVNIIVDFEFDSKKFPGDWITWPVPNGRRTVPVKSCEQITFDF